jgi:hypothetical protein
LTQEIEDGQVCFVRLHLGSVITLFIDIYQNGTIVRRIWSF